MGAAHAPRPSTPRVHGRAKRHPNAVSNPEGPTMTKRVAAFCAALITFVVFLIVALWGETFGIDGGTTGALHPGSSVPINVRITNSHFYPIYVTGLKVRITSITPAHKGEKCDASNYSLTQSHDFTVRVAAFSAVSMPSIESSSSKWPALHLTGKHGTVDNGCQGATVNLAFSASGSWWKK
jgi:hypothetical protein